MAYVKQSWTWFLSRLWGCCLLAAWLVLSAKSMKWCRRITHLTLLFGLHHRVNVQGSKITDTERGLPSDPLIVYYVHKHEIRPWSTCTWTVLLIWNEKNFQLLIYWAFAVFLTWWLLPSWFSSPVLKKILYSYLINFKFCIIVNYKPCYTTFSVVLLSHDFKRDDWHFFMWKKLVDFFLRHC